jgi:hypothetical protein
MPLRSLEACFFIEEPPEFDYRDGLFHVRQTVGDMVFERVMRPHVFILSLKRAADAAGQHFRGGAEIIDLAKRLEDRAAAHH